MDNEIEEILNVIKKKFKIEGRHDADTMVQKYEEIQYILAFMQEIS